MSEANEDQLHRLVGHSIRVLLKRLRMIYEI